MLKMVVLLYLGVFLETVQSFLREKRKEIREGWADRQVAWVGAYLKLLDL